MKTHWDREGSDCIKIMSVSPSSTTKVFFDFNFNQQRLTGHKCNAPVYSVYQPAQGQPAKPLHGEGLYIYITCFGSRQSHQWSCTIIKKLSTGQTHSFSILYLYLIGSLDFDRVYKLHACPVGGSITSGVRNSEQKKTATVTIQRFVSFPPTLHQFIINPWKFPAITTDNG